jgi:hypothetical protein
VIILDFRQPLPLSAEERRTILTVAELCEHDAPAVCSAAPAGARPARNSDTRTNGAPRAVWCAGQHAALHRVTGVAIAASTRAAKVSRGGLRRPDLSALN